MRNFTLRSSPRLIRAGSAALLLGLLATTSDCGEERFECDSPGDCWHPYGGKPPNPCMVDACIGNRCEQVPRDEPWWGSSDVANDCRELVCRDGTLVFIPDDDPPVADDSLCYTEVCSEERIVAIARPAGTPCGNFSSYPHVCDGAGICEYRAPPPCHDLCTGWVEQGCAIDYFLCGTACTPSEGCIEEQTQYFACLIAQDECGDPEDLCWADLAAFEACQYPEECSDACGIPINTPGGSCACVRQCPGHLWTVACVPNPDDADEDLCECNFDEQLLGTCTQLASSCQDGTLESCCGALFP